MRRFSTALLLSGLLLTARTAAAESPITFTLEFKFGPYSLSRYDGEPGLTVDPNEQIFGSGAGLMFQSSLEWIVWDGFGSIGLAATTGYWQKSGKGLYAIDHTRSSDSTTFSIVPFKATLNYRFNYFERRNNFPFVPYGKVGFDWYLWWIRNESGGLARWTDGAGGEHKGIGGTFGMDFVYGVQFLLDIIDPPSARSFDVDIGVNNTFIFIEGVYSWVDDFGSKSSHDLSDHSFLAGLMFEF